MARTCFSDDLRVVFENPVTMKRFMETFFWCGRRGLHVGSRTKIDNYVTGQPDGLREDALRLHINPGKLKEQWTCRRLLFRTQVDVQLGAHSSTGGLTAADRDFVAASLSDGATCSTLRELGCTVRFIKGGPSGKRPVALDYLWDVVSTWFPNGIEAALVGVLRTTLMKVTPVLHADRELGKGSISKASSRPGSRKRPVELVASDAAPAHAAKKANNALVTSVDDPDGTCCSKCGRQTGDDGATSRQATSVATQTAEHWSADVTKSAAFPHGGHVLSCTLPMYMDTGPSGRVIAVVDVNKTSAVGDPVFTYSLFFTPGTHSPTPVDSVPGAAFISSDEQGQAPPSHSLDLLRAVKTFFTCREQSRPAYATTGATGDTVHHRLCV